MPRHEGGASAETPGNRGEPTVRTGGLGEGGGGAAAVPGRGRIRSCRPSGTTRRSLELFLSVTGSRWRVSSSGIQLNQHREKPVLAAVRRGKKGSRGRV